MRLLFQVEVGRLPLDHVLDLAREQGRPAGDDWEFAEERVRGVLTHQDELDVHIRALSSGWSLERLANVDRTLLRLALYELIHQPETPPAVVINDAVELAQRYSTDDSPRFVNGILGSFHRGRAVAPAVVGEETE